MTENGNPEPQDERTEAERITDAYLGVAGEDWDIVCLKRPHPPSLDRGTP